MCKIGQRETTIETECFYGVELKELRLPNRLKKIGMMAFERCGVDVLDISESVEQIVAVRCTISPQLLFGATRS